MGYMRKSRLSKSKQDRLVEHFVAGATARCAAALVGVNSKTAVYYFHRLREIVAYQLEQDVDTVFSGEIEVDESYFGGKRKGKRGRGAGGKVPVFGLLKRGGKVYTKIIPMLRRRLYSPLLSARWCPTVSFIPIAGKAITCWMFPTSSTSGSTTRNSLLTGKITSMASRTFGTKRSVTCANSMVFQRSISSYS